MINISYQWITIECPKCNYADDIQMIEVKIEKIHFCNNCKIQIQLQDSEGSVHYGIVTINKAFRDLETLFKNFGR